MYQNNIDLSLKILGLFLVTNVVGVSLNNNQTSISKEAPEITTTTLRSVESSDHPNHGELKFFKVMCW
jgi:hypothetical protein